MPKPKRPRDPNQLAKLVVDIATGMREPDPEPSPKATAGREGGLKGGPERARKLSSKRRKEIAKKAAEIRWKNHG